ncbi:MAG: PD-(D/E)XK nuclease family protein [Pelagimonas sp.]|jgi:hypothetical protein|nr:PD-(D/E)XK nuclease family protein [Pelagimonas sp.]
MQLTPIYSQHLFTSAVRTITTDFLKEAYLCPHTEFSDVSDFLKAAEFPWAGSYQQDPAGIEKHVKAMLRDLMQATPELDAQNIDLSSLPEGRAKVHLLALKTLWERCGTLPDDLATIRHVIMSDANDALESLPLTTDTPCAFANEAQRSLHSALLAHHGTRSLQKHSTPNSGGFLHHVQVNLLCDCEPQNLDDSVAFIGVRDLIEEAEFAAARIQKRCNEGMKTQDFGILLPEDPLYHSALASAFARFGLPISGLHGDPLRDHSAEVLTLTLNCLKSHSARMAKASLCLSPLMPWDAQQGHEISRAIMFGGLGRILEDRPEAKSILDLLRPVTSYGALFARLDALSKHLRPSDFSQRIAGLRPLATDAPIDWHKLEQTAVSRDVRSDAPPMTVEGVSLFSANALPWRPVKELIILGMTGANWPTPVRANPFFTESEFELIAQKTGLVLSSRKRILARNLELFRQQIGAAETRLTLCASARDLMGKRLGTSVALTLIAKACGELKDPMALLRSPVSDDASIENVPLDPELCAPRLPTGDSVMIGGNLMLLRHEAGTNIMKPQSVSRLETMLTAPLAWALGEIGAEEHQWLPQKLDVMLLGTIVHEVLEHSFPEGCNIPDDAELSDRLPQIFSDAINKNAPWLCETAWDLERQNLFIEASSAALSWAGFLRTTGAEVLGNEQHLQGSSPSLLIRTHGYADCLLRLPDGKIMVVDHKRSKSAKRLGRLEKSADLQATLYKEMLLNPQGDDALDLRETGANNIIPAYHTTLDHTVVAGENAHDIAGIQTVPGDIASAALDLLSDRIKDLTVGKIPLSTTADDALFSKDMGITPYALHDNRIVSAFLIDEQGATA